jgi:hypothetical protein
VPTIGDLIAFGEFDPPLAAIPLPPAVWLLGSAIGLLGWMRRSAA